MFGISLAVLIPLGILGLIRWFTWLIRRIPAAFYKPYDGDFDAPLTLVAPVYQEDPEIFRAAIESWMDAGVDEIICVIDSTDPVSIDVAREYPVEVIITDVPGKRDALRKGWERASHPFVALVDSDTLWASNVKERVLQPFADPEIGGVGTRQNVYNPKTLWQHVNDMFLDYRYFDEIAAQTRVGRAVSCLSGRTAVYRRELLLEVSDEFMGETFMGVTVNSGEDKRLTTLVLKRGYYTYMQQDARVWSTFPAGLRKFFLQRLRWSRNTWRSDLRALYQLWIFRHRFLAFTTIDKAIGSFSLLVSPTFMTFSLLSQAWVVAGALGAWWLVSRSVKHLPHLIRRPSHFLIMPVFVLVSFAIAIAKIYALFTIRKQLWLTRDVAVVGGRVVRTSPEVPVLAGEESVA